jgi:signal transduction histidine kinase
MDGFELSKLIRNRKKTSHIPIILLTAAYLSDRYKQKGFEMGAEDYITKPIDDNLLINRIKAYLKPIQKERAFSYELEKKVIERTIELEKEIEERKKIQEELIKAKEHAEEETRNKSMLLSTMSHEIRTPMNGILATINLLLEDNPKEEYLEALRIMKFSSENMVTIINDILDLNKIEANKIKLENIDFSLFQLVSSIKFSMNIKAMEKGIEVESIIAHNVPEIVKGDPVRLGQILNNLVSNAVKFTEKGKIVIKIDYLSEKENSYKLLFSVMDTGIGISEEQMSKLFQPFTQASDETTRKYGGTGLGLLISQNLANLMNSEIEIKSKLKEGSTFYFEVELGKSSKTIFNKESNNFIYGSLKGLNVLIVEDNKINQMVASRFLKKWDVEVDFADNGVIAVNKVQSKKYDLILMDLQMPEMNGYEATKEIRSFEDKYFKEIPIIALTASNVSDVEENVKNYGMECIISKPFNPIELYKTLSQYLKLVK